MKKNTLIILLSIFVLSCNSNDDDRVMTKVTSTLIAKGNLFGNGDEGIIEQKLEITNQNSFDNLISKMNSVNNVSDSFSEIKIDFSQYKIIAVFDEIKGNGGHSLDLNIMSNSKNIIVNISGIATKGNVTSVNTQPFHIVRILNSNRPVIFK